MVQFLIVLRSKKDRLGYSALDKCRSALFRSPKGRHVETEPDLLQQGMLFVLVGTHVFLQSEEESRVAAIFPQQYRDSKKGRHGRPFHDPENQRP